MNSAPSTRPDTLVTLVHDTDSGHTMSGQRNAALRYVMDTFPGTEIVGVWRYDENGGYRSWAVEHAPEPMILPGFSTVRVVTDNRPVVDDDLAYELRGDK